MDKKLKNFLDGKKIAEKKEKQEKLIKLGLYEKVYATNDDLKSESFSATEWEEEWDNFKFKYYKKIPIEITDEEYNEVLKYSNHINTVADVLKAIAWIIFIGGFIAGIALGNTKVVKGVYYTYTATEFSFTIAFIYWFTSFISGTIFLGFAEIIQLLQDIKNK